VQRARVGKVRRVALECAMFAWWCPDTIPWTELHVDDIEFIRSRLVDRLRAGWPENGRGALARPMSSKRQSSIS